jgi:hypothetical protein
MYSLWKAVRRATPTLILVSALGLAASDARAGEFTFGGKVYADLSQLQQRDYAAGTETDAVDADLKRLYLDADYAFDPAWSVHLTTDINWLRGKDGADLWLKRLYVQHRFSDATTVRVGADAMPWLSLNSKWYGYRYIDSVGTSQQKIDSAADWGVHLKSRLAPNVDVAVAVVSGAGYKRPSHGRRADVEALVAWHASKHTVFALGGYDGQLAADNDDPARPLYHSARRVDLMAAYADDTWRFGVRYAYASNWANLYSQHSERVRNWSGWISMQMAAQWAVFARYDYTTPMRLLDPSRKTRYANAGVEWKPRKGLRLALVFKHNALQRHGDLLRRSNEAGIWSEWVF